MSRWVTYRGDVGRARAPSWLHIEKVLELDGGSEMSSHHESKAYRDTPLARLLKNVARDSACRRFSNLSLGAESAEGTIMIQVAALVVRTEFNIRGKVHAAP